MLWQNMNSNVYSTIYKNNLLVPLSTSSEFVSISCNSFHPGIDLLQKHHCIAVWFLESVYISNLGVTVLWGTFLRLLCRGGYHGIWSSGLECVLSLGTNCRQFDFKKWSKSTRYNVSTLLLMKLSIINCISLLSLSTSWLHFSPKWLP